MQRTKTLFFIFIALFAAQVFVFGQSKPQTTQSLKKRMKELDEKKAEQKQEEIELTEYLKAKHAENQSKEVRKRMKKSQKKANRHNQNKKEFFLKRWFSKY